MWHTVGIWQVLSAHWLNSLGAYSDLLSINDDWRLRRSTLVKYNDDENGDAEGEDNIDFGSVSSDDHQDDLDDIIYNDDPFEKLDLNAQQKLLEDTAAVCTVLDKVHQKKMFLVIAVSQDLLYLIVYVTLVFIFNSLCSNV